MTAALGHEIRSSLGWDVTRRLDEDGDVLYGRVREPFGKRGQADVPNPDVLVPVPAGAECVLQVVGVDRLHASGRRRSEDGDSHR